MSRSVTSICVLLVVYLVGGCGKSPAPSGMEKVQTSRRLDWVAVSHQGDQRIFLDVDKELSRYTKLIKQTNKRTKIELFETIRPAGSDSLTLVDVGPELQARVLGQITDDKTNFHIVELDLNSGTSASIVLLYESDAGRWALKYFWPIVRWAIGGFDSARKGDGYFMLESGRASERLGPRNEEILPFPPSAD